MNKIKNKLKNQSSTQPLDKVGTYSNKLINIAQEIKSKNISRIEKKINAFLEVLSYRIGVLGKLEKQDCNAIKDFITILVTNKILSFREIILYFRK